jgi:glycolate oxidase FAD binding subunit
MSAIRQFREQIQARKPLRIRGAGSKDFYGNVLTGDVLDTRAHSGIVSYEPSELVATVKAGTPIAELTAALAEKKQWLPFEPPMFAAGGKVGGTVGGMVASGLAGPGRLSAGSVRDFVLGVTLMDGEGRVLKFGGEVMKNVAGFDVSRLMAGSLGTLGLLLDVSIKVLPQPIAQTTLCFEMSEAAALMQLNRWAGQPIPITASAWHEGALHLRLAGARAAVASAVALLTAKVSAGDTAITPDAHALWASLRDQRHAFFAGDAPLWRLALPSTTAPLNLGATLIEWGGAQRWLRGEFDPAHIRAIAREHGGHATLFRGSQSHVPAFTSAFTPLDPITARVHAQLKARFDPHGVFNPGRLF